MYHYIYRMNHLLLVLLVLNVNIYNLMLDTMVYLVLLLETDSVEREQRVAAGWTWHWFTFFFSQARNYVSSLPNMPKRNFAHVFIGANPQGNNRGLTDRR